MSQSTIACEIEDVYQASYVEFVISIPLCIVFQFTILFRSIHYEIHQPSDQKMKLSLRITFIMLQVSGLYFVINDLFRFVIGPFTSMYDNNIMCNIGAISPKMIIPIYYACYLFHILLRLYGSFQKSYFELKKSTIICLSMFFWILPGILCVLLFFCPAPCHWIWLPNDLNATLSLCVFRHDVEPIVSIAILLAICLVVIANSVYAIIFGAKLNKLLSSQQKENKEISFQLKTIVIKNSILTIIGCSSTLINYVLWLIIYESTHHGSCFLYLDVCINISVIALMFKYNEKYYKSLCCCCIVYCLTKVDTTYDSTNTKQMNEIMMEIGYYLNNPSILSTYDDTSVAGSCTSLDKQENK